MARLFRFACGRHALACSLGALSLLGHSGEGFGRTFVSAPIIIEAPNGQSTLAFDVNDSGIAIGVYDISDEVAHAFRWSRKGGFVDLHFGEGESSFASAINACGEIAGAFDLAFQGFGFPVHATRWTRDGEAEDLGTLGGPDSSAGGINDRGNVVGVSDLANGEGHAFLWTEDDGMRDLGSLGGTLSAARDINNRNEVVGFSEASGGQRHAFLWTRHAGMTDLGTFGGVRSEAFAINDDSEVVGLWQPAGESIRGFKWTRRHGMIDLGDLGGNFGTAALDINRRGLIVGFSSNPNGVDRATLWARPTVALEIDPNVGMTSVARAVTERGLIAGIITLDDFGEDARGVVWRLRHRAFDSHHSRNPRFCKR